MTLSGNKTNRNDIQTWNYNVHNLKEIYEKIFTLTSYKKQCHIYIENYELKYFTNLYN